MASDPVTPSAAPERAAFASELLRGLRARRRSLSPKFFYDRAGSALFDRICELDEYYPTRTECALLRRHANEIAGCIGAAAEIVEFGAGSLHKIRLLLPALPRPVRFVPIDISTDHLAASAAALRRDWPGLAVQPLALDYTQPPALALPPLASPARRRVGFFPGSSIGNFTPAQARRFLARCAALLRGGGLLVGVDLVKDPALLHAAYNDAQGVTAAFNRNLLVRANRELGADFDPAAFDHSAFYNAPLQRIEMHLVSTRDQVVSVCGERFRFEHGRTLHTENSYKYSVEGFRRLARAAGFAPTALWADPDSRFSVHWLKAPA